MSAIRSQTRHFREDVRDRKIVVRPPRASFADRLQKARSSAIEAGGRLVEDQDRASVITHGFSRSLASCRAVVAHAPAADRVRSGQNAGTGIRGATGGRLRAESRQEFQVSAPV